MATLTTRLTNTIAGMVADLSGRERPRGSAPRRPAHERRQDRRARRRIVGTTYAAVIADAGFPVALWARREETVEEINTAHTNSRYLGDREPPETITATTDDIAAVTDADVVILAVPAQTLRENLSRWKAHLRPDVRLVSLMKGIEVETGKRMSEVIAEVAEVDPGRIAVVSGPNLAREIAERQPTATVVASSDAATAEVVAEISANAYFRPYTNTDVVGVEMGGAVKNVIALAVGIADGRASATTRRPRSSPAASPRPPVSPRRWEPSRTRSPVSPGSATSSPHAPPRSRAIARSGATSARG